MPTVDGLHIADMECTEQPLQAGSGRHCCMAGPRWSCGPRDYRHLASSWNSVLHLSSPSARRWMASRLDCSVASAPAATCTGAGGGRHCGFGQARHANAAAALHLLAPCAAASARQLLWTGPAATSAGVACKAFTNLSTHSPCALAKQTCEHAHELCVRLGKQLQSHLGGEVAAHRLQERRLEGGGRRLCTERERRAQATCAGCTSTQCTFTHVAVSRPCSSQPAHDRRCNRGAPRSTNTKH